MALRAATHLLDLETTRMRHHTHGAESGLADFLRDIEQRLILRVFEVKCN